MSFASAQLVVFAVALSSAALSPPAAAQPASRLSSPPGMERADPGISDIDPLRLSLRELQVDLRRPTGFDTVYRMDATPQQGGRGSLFMRMDGGITAVFPRSVYAQGRAGPTAQIPPGTVFYLGDLPANLQPAPTEAPRPPGYLDLGIDASAPVRALTAPDSRDWEAQPGNSTPVERTIWNDDDFRRHRIATLLARSGASPASRPPSGEERPTPEAREDGPR